MSRRRKKHATAIPADSSGRLTIDRARRSGHYQGTHCSEVYRDGKVHVYTAWNDNDDDVGKELDFDEWVASLRR